MVTFNSSFILVLYTSVSKLCFPSRHTGILNCSNLHLQGGIKICRITVSYVAVMLPFFQILCFSVCVSSEAKCLMYRYCTSTVTFLCQALLSCLILTLFCGKTVAWGGVYLGLEIGKAFCRFVTMLSWVLSKLTYGCNY